MLAHGMVEGRETTEILNLLDVTFHPHASVEPVKAAHDADDPSTGVTTKDCRSRSRVARDVGNNEAVQARERLPGKRKLDGPGAAHDKSGIEAGEIVARINGVKLGLSLWVAATHARHGQKRLRNRTCEGSKGTGEGQDCQGGECRPGADLPDVPPKIFGVWVPEREGERSHERGGRVWSPEVGEDRGS